MKSAFLFLTLTVLLVIVVSTAAGFNLFSINKDHFLNPQKFKGIVKDVENGVRHMEQQAHDEVSALLWRHVIDSDKKKKAGVTPKLIQDSFRWVSCGAKDQLVNIHSLSVQPQPLFFPGDMQLSFNVEFRHTVPSAPDLNGTLFLEIETGGNWIKIPCLGNIGSCDYKDLCSMLKPIARCPDPFVSQKIPCKCPFSKGDYEINNFNIEIDAAVFLPGNYRGKVTLANKQGQLGCYQLFFTIG